jgi:hypothetical protein
VHAFSHHAERKYLARRNFDCAVPSTRTARSSSNRREEILSRAGAIYFRRQRRGADLARLDEMGSKTGRSADADRIVFAESAM